jgi:opacity protein-like surface antigen
MTIRRTLLATTALALGLTFTTAEAGDRSMYFTVGGGGNWLDDQSGRATASGDYFGPGATADIGFVLRAAVGGQVDGVVDGLRIEVEASYRHNDATGYLLSYTTLWIGGPFEVTESTFAVLANAWYEFDIGNLHPYFGGGAGWADTEIEGDFFGSIVGPSRDIDSSGNGFAWQLGAGINYDVSPNVAIGIGYRYFSGPDVDILPLALANNAGSATWEVTTQSVVLDLSFKL